MDNLKILFSPTLLLFVIITVLFIVIIEKFNKKKKWYFQGAALMTLGILLLAFAHLFAWRIECYFLTSEDMCGVASILASSMLAVSTFVIGFGFLIKDFFVKRKKK